MKVAVKCNKNISLLLFLSARHWQYYQKQEHLTDAQQKVAVRCSCFHFTHALNMKDRSNMETKTLIFIITPNPLEAGAVKP
ncbi:MAG: hypothetical protein PHV07_10090 [Oscillospiraceae bacterium]|nr:hypothetical protein [Oscillospiraceae bacterium]